MEDFFLPLGGWYSRDQKPVLSVPLRQVYEDCHPVDLCDHSTPRMPHVGQLACIYSLACCNYCLPLLTCSFPLAACVVTIVLCV